MADFQHIFFDLDHTLWDFETNSRRTIETLFEDRSLSEKTGCDAHTFYEKYIEINDAKWALYRTGTITKERLRAERFADTYASFGYVDQHGAAEFERDYLATCPYQTTLMEGALEIVSYLSENYHLNIITNGFHETQKIKLRESRLEPYFRNLICSDVVGVNKPNRRIFAEALRLSGALRKSSVMIGDNLAIDVLGARDSGLSQVFYNPDRQKHGEKITFEVSELSQLKQIF